MNIMTNPLFWVVLSLLGMLAGNAIAGRTDIGSSRLFGMATIATVLLPRFVIPLGFIEQSRFAFEYQTVLGGILMFSAFVLWMPLYKIVWSTGPSQKEQLQTSGVYSMVRHPGYFGDTLIVLGWAVYLGSVPGVLLTPVWLAAFYLHSLIEENSLIAEYGAQYHAYKSRVRSRIVPFLPL